MSCGWGLGVCSTKDKSVHKICVISSLETLVDTHVKLIGFSTLANLNYVPCRFFQSLRFSSGHRRAVLSYADIVKL